MRLRTSRGKIKNPRNIEEKTRENPRKPEKTRENPRKPGPRNWMLLPTEQVTLAK
jgi:hypothetical protein